MEDVPGQDSISLMCGRQLLFGSVSQIPWDRLKSPFALLVPASTEADVQAMAAVAEELMARGCVSFSAVGPLAERLEDVADETYVRWALDDDRSFPADTLMTTGHTDTEDAFDYFVLCTMTMVDGGLVALLNDHPELKRQLSAYVHDFNNSAPQ